MTDRPSIVEFLRARLDEDERVAQGAGGPKLAFPTWDVDAWYDGTGERADLRARVGGNLTNQGGLEVLIAAHAARWDPARVLAEVEAKRRIISRCEKLLDGHAASSELDWEADFLAHDVLLDLAAPYASHPDYQPGWVPADTPSP